MNSALTSASRSDAARSLNAGNTAIRGKGPLHAHRFLILRRAAQLGLLALFLAGPIAGLWLIKGNLSSSLTLDTLALSDPYLVLQGLIAGHSMHVTATVGALIVIVFYLLVGGRVYCSWVCPVNILTDAAAWLRRRLRLPPRYEPSRLQRYWILAATLGTAFATGSIAWELVNPVSIIYRGILFGLGMGWILIAAIFLYDLFVTRHGWCGHLCPVGAFYALIGSASLLRISARHRSRCNDCADCYRVCPEPQVLAPALKQAGSPVIGSGICTNCARCIDVCNRDVFRFAIRFDHRSD